MTVEHSQRIERESGRNSERDKHSERKTSTNTDRNNNKYGPYRNKERKRERDTKFRMNKERPGVSPGLMVMA